MDLVVHGTMEFQGQDNQIWVVLVTILALLPTFFCVEFLLLSWQANPLHWG